MKNSKINFEGLLVKTNSSSFKKMEVSYKKFCAEYDIHIPKNSILPMKKTVFDEVRGKIHR